MSKNNSSDNNALDSKSVKTSDQAKSSAGFSITTRLKITNRPGMFASVVQKLGEADASLAEVILHASDFSHTTRDVTISCKSSSHSAEILELIKNTPDVELIDWQDDTMAVHRHGKLRTTSVSPLMTTDQLARAYTPGVARVCDLIAKDEKQAFAYTIKANTVAVVSDGSAVLGLGNIGPFGAMPVMEGKSVLFKEFGGIDSFPICLKTQDPDEIIKIVKAISPCFGGINLEDIAAPNCFYIEQKLQEELEIPVFHDDQHGTAVVVLAALMNCQEIKQKPLSELKYVINGFGAAGVAIAKILIESGVKNIIPCDSAGIIYRGRKLQMNPIKEQLLEQTNPENIQGTLADAVKGADVFVGVSKPGVLNRAMVETMNDSPLIFALSNPTPEIYPEELKGIHGIIATGRSDYANQINNVLCFPGIFRGALDAGAMRITANMKIEAARAISECVTQDEITKGIVIPSAFNRTVVNRVAQYVKEAAIREGVIRTAVKEPRVLPAWRREDQIDEKNV